VSAAALGRIARALRLTPSEESYLFLLAGVARASPVVTPTRLPTIRDVQAVVDGLKYPGLVCGPLGDVVVYNRAADALFDFGACDGPFADNHVWRLFRDPKRKALYVNWEAVALRTVGYIRMRVSRYAGDSRLEALCAELRADHDFVALWERATVLPEGTLDVHLRHPRLGEVRARSVRLHLADADDHVLATLVPADARSTLAFERLRQRSTRTRSGAPPADGKR
jgi:hypothetical protein